MAKKSKKERLKTKFSFLSNEFLVVRSSLGLLLITFGAFMLAPLKDEGDVSKLLLVLIYLIVLILWFVLIAEFIMKTMKLQNAKKVTNFATVLGINSFFGMFIPIFISRVVMNNMMFDFLAQISKADTIFCDLRSEIISYYRYFQVDYMLSNVAMWTLFLSIVVLIGGNLLEKGWSK